MPDNIIGKEKSDKYLETYGIHKYEVENCYDTLIRADEIKKDSKKIAAIKELSKEKKKEPELVMDSIDNIEEAREKKFGSKAKDFFEEEPEEETKEDK